MTSISIGLTVLTISLSVATVLSVKHQDDMRDRLLLGSLAAVSALGTVASLFA